MGKAPALSDKMGRSGTAGLGPPALLIGSVDKISQRILFMPSFVKGQGGGHLQPPRRHLHSMQKTGDMPMIPEIIRRPAVQGNRRNRRHGQRLITLVAYCYLHHFKGTPVPWHKGSDNGRKLVSAGCSVQPMPHKAGLQHAFLLFLRSSQRLCLGASARCRPSPLLCQAPEISAALQAVQLFHADGLQQKGILVQLAVPSQKGRDAAFQTRFSCQRKIEIAAPLGICHSKRSVLIHKGICLHCVTPLFTFSKLR